MAARRRRRRRRFWWEDFRDEELLDVRLRDLGLKIEGTTLEKRVQRLRAEFERAGFRFRPYVWLSLDWFTPDGLTGFAIPFFLAHQRLLRLEHRQMFQVEGGTHRSCMRLLRHEAGHALDNAYRLHRRKSWREVFGRFSEPYRADYWPRPRSRDFVLNLDGWYAQSHPAEDWAETFAVWLHPGSRWRRHYTGWPALAKLEYVDGLMESIRGQQPKLRTREKPDSLPQLRTTLREYYRNKKRFYSFETSQVNDRLLRRLFSDDPSDRRTETAARFLERRANELRRSVSSLTGQHRYVLDQALAQMVTRCRELGLRRVRSPQESLTGSAILLTLVTRSFTRGQNPHFHR